jgi:hypothetical protein
VSENLELLDVNLIGQGIWLVGHQGKITAPPIRATLVSSEHFLT